MFAVANCAATLTDAIAAVDGGKLANLVAVQTGASFGHFAGDLDKRAARDVRVGVERDLDVAQVRGLDEQRVARHFLYFTDDAYGLPCVLRQHRRVDHGRWFVHRE